MIKNRLVGLLIALACVVSIGAKTIYLVPNQWTTHDAKFSVYSIKTQSFSAFLSSSDNVHYEATVDDDTQIIFVRHSSDATTPSWENKWNQTDDLSIPSGKNCWSHTTWGSNGGKCTGTWSAYTPEGSSDGEDVTDPEVRSIALAGTMNDWNTSASPMVKSEDGLTASYTMYLEAQSYEFKVVVGDEWLGNQGTMTRDNCTGWTFEKGDGSEKYNCTISADVDGDYTFTWELSTNKLSVVYPEESDQPEVAPEGYKLIYLNTANLWNSDNAKFFVHAWQSDGEHVDLPLSILSGCIYKVYIPEDYTHVVFVRQSPASSSLVWEGELFWNKTADLEIPAGKDCYTIRGWGETMGAWTVYGQEPYPDLLNGSAVPSACPDVMLQGFYWDSNQDKYYGNTRWSTLQTKAKEIAAYFDLVWLPPSAKSSGGLGYHPQQYSNQNSDLGTREELEKLISSLHEGGAKVVADIVINHIDGSYGWCSFAEQDFGEYGTFQVDGSYICQDDDMNFDPTAGDCKGTATGPYDDGYGEEAKYGAARDLAHDSEKVREMCRAYTQWMVNEMKYDGFRYDYCKGFHMSHVNDYNTAADAYFSVLEYYDGNRDVLWERIQDAQENTLVFDFGMKFNVMNSGIAQFNYAACKGPNCLIGMGKGKWAVNFIDNHDTFERGNGCDFGGDAMSSGMKDRLLQANAYMLSMPGVPCVFYPHWVKYGDAIKAMILARKAAGVHSESAVSDEADGTGYRAYVTGSKGMLIVELGGWLSSSHDGYTEVAAGSGYKMWVSADCVVPELTVYRKSTTYRTETLSVSMGAVGLGGTPKIYYTLDGTDPRTSATKKLYSSALTISGTVTLKAYAELNGKKSDVQTYEYTYEAPQEEPITISFKKPAEWSKVYLYSWTANNTYPTGTWPGMLMTEENSNGFYYHTFSDTQERPINFIFHNNAGTQSEDLLTYEDVCYGWEYDAAKVVSCSQGGVTTELERVEEVDAPRLNLNKSMYNIVGQRVDANYHGIVIQNGYKYLR